MKFWERVVVGLVLAGSAAAASAGVVVVLNSGDATISLIDQDTRKEIRRFEVGKEPHHLMATPDGRTLIVANAAGNDLMFLDPKTGEVQRRVRAFPIRTRSATRPTRSGSSSRATA